jgi:hypothetical protein
MTGDWGTTAPALGRLRQDSLEHWALQPAWKHSLNKKRKQKRDTVSREDSLYCGISTFLPTVNLKFL